MFKNYRHLWMALLALVVLSPLGLLATGTAFGEWGLDELIAEVGFIPQGLAKTADLWQHAIFPDYSIPGLTATFTQTAVGYIFSAVVGVLLVAGIVALFGKGVKD